MTPFDVLHLNRDDDVTHGLVLSAEDVVESWWDPSLVTEMRGGAVSPGGRHRCGHLTQLPRHRC